jgi:uncharacterized membrane protein YhaH (DUF805 family)
MIRLSKVRGERALQLFAGLCLLVFVVVTAVPLVLEIASFFTVGTSPEQEQARQSWMDQHHRDGLVHVLSFVLPVLTLGLAPLAVAHRHGIARVRGLKGRFLLVAGLLLVLSLIPGQYLLAAVVGFVNVVVIGCLRRLPDHEQTGKAEGGSVDEWVGGEP